MKNQTREEEQEQKALTWLRKRDWASLMTNGVQTLAEPLWREKEKN